MKKKEIVVLLAGWLLYFFICPFNGASEEVESTASEQTVITVKEEEYPVKIPKIPGAVLRPTKIPSQTSKTIPQVKAPSKADKWWIPQKPYHLWNRETLFKQIREMQELRSSMIAQGERMEVVQSVNQQIEEAQAALEQNF